MMLLDFSQKLEPLTPEETYQVLVNALDLRSGFGIFFLQCSPGEANRLIPRVQQDLQGRNIEVLDLVEPIDNLYKLVKGRSDRITLNILFVRGLEKSLEADIKPGYKGLGDYYNLNTIPLILSHLNQQRENFRDHFSNICFVFLLPKFAIRYFVRRAPDFYDWNSGVFEIPNLLHDKMIVLPQLHPDLTVQDSTSEGDFLFRSRRYEEAITSYDRAVATKPNDYEAWHSRGISLYYLGRYEEAITSYDRAIKIKPNYHEAWYNRGNSLDSLGRYIEAIASYDRAIKIKPNYQEALCSRGFSLDEWGRYADG